MENENKTPTEESTSEKPGFFKRIFVKIDDAMKAKADEASENGCGCDDGKGGKCC